jgi:hypothetical protein
MPFGGPAPALGGGWPDMAMSVLSLITSRALCGRYTGTAAFPGLEDGWRRLM